MNDVVQDFQLAGRGVSRVRYKPEYGMVKVEIPVITNPETGQYVDADGQPIDPSQIQQSPTGSLFIEQEVEDVLGEQVEFEYVDYNHFNHSTERGWRKVWWVSFDNYLYKEEVIEMFGAKIAEKLAYNKRTSNDKDKVAEAEEEKYTGSKALVVELWDKLSRKVRYLSDSLKDEFLKVEEDPLGLREFFPVPRPLINNKSTRSLKGRPDFIYYEGHVRELDKVCERRYTLITALRCVGVHDKAFDAVLKNIFQTTNNKTYPIDWPRFMEAGGFEGIFQLLPLADVVAQIQQLSASEETIQARIYEISGISDIIRGQSNPNETATAQQIKGQYATLRLAEKQTEVQRVARDLVELASEIIAEKFQPQTIKNIAGVEYYSEEDKALVPKAIQTLRNDGLRRIRIDIETDSTIAVDEALQKEQFGEFVIAITDLFQRAFPIIQAKPAYQGVFDEILKKAARVYRFGKQFDAAIAQAILSDKDQQEQAAGQPPPPDPMMIKIENDMNISLQKLDLEKQKSAADIAIQAERIRQEFDLKRAELQNSHNNKTIEGLRRIKNG